MYRKTTINLSKSNNFSYCNLGRRLAKAYILAGNLMGTFNRFKILKNLISSHLEKQDDCHSREPSCNRVISPVMQEE